MYDDVKRHSVCQNVRLYVEEDWYMCFDCGYI